MNYYVMRSMFWMAPLSVAAAVTLSTAGYRGVNYLFDQCSGGYCYDREASEALKERRAGVSIKHKKEAWAETAAAEAVKQANATSGPIAVGAPSAVATSGVTAQPPVQAPVLSDQELFPSITEAQKAGFSEEELKAIELLEQVEAARNQFVEDQETFGPASPQAIESLRKMRALTQEMLNHGQRMGVEGLNEIELPVIPEIYAPNASTHTPRHSTTQNQVKEPVAVPTAVELIETVRGRAAERRPTPSPAAVPEPAPTVSPVVTVPSVDAVSSANEKPSVVKLGFDANGDPLSAEERARQIAAVAERLDPNFTINYPAQGEEKGQIFVFTDPSCPYCQRMHADFWRMQADGYTVRALFFPRGGLSDAAMKARMESVWCSEDSALAMSQLWERNIPPSGRCETLPEEKAQFGDIVTQHFIIAHIMGVRATPTIFASNGGFVEGYGSWAQLKGQWAAE